MKELKKVLLLAVSVSSLTSAFEPQFLFLSSIMAPNTFVLCTPPLEYERAGSRSAGDLAEEYEMDRPAILLHSGRSRP